MLRNAPHEKGVVLVLVMVLVFMTRSCSAWLMNYCMKSLSSIQIGSFSTSVGHGFTFHWWTCVNMSSFLCFDWLKIETLKRQRISDSNPGAMTIRVGLLLLLATSQVLVDGRSDVKSTTKGPG